jgi:hypothetical protein
LTVELGFKSLWPAANKRLALFVVLTINPSSDISALHGIDTRFAFALHGNGTMANFCCSHDQTHLDAATSKEPTTVISAWASHPSFQTTRTDRIKKVGIAFA